MKQTNNAIKFLMAQYRAIFKNANLKMFLAAATAAAALAAGQAQAQSEAISDTNFGSIAAKDSAYELNGTDSDPYSKIEISATKKDLTNDKVFELKLVNGNAHKIENTGADTELSVKAEKATLSIAGKDAKLTIGANKSGATVTLGSLGVTEGTLEIGAATATKKTNVSAGTITLGGEEKKTAAVTVEAAGVLAGTKTLEIGKGATLTIAQDGQAYGATTTINDGKVVLGGTLGNAGKVELNGGTVSVATGATGSILGSTITLNDKATIENSGSLTIGDADSTFTMNSGTITNDSKQKITFAGGADLKKGTVTNKGTLILNGESTIAADVITQSGDQAEVQIGESSKANMTAKAFNGLLTGKLSVSGGSGTTSELHITDTAALNLGKGTKDADLNLLVDAGSLNTKVSNSGDGVLKVTGAEATFSGEKIDAEVTLGFDKMTLGKTNFAVSGSAGLEVKNLLTIGDGNGALTVTNGAVTFVGEDGAIKAKTVELKAESGHTAELVVNSGKLGVQGLTITDGTVKVLGGSTLNVAGDISVASGSVGLSGNSILNVSGNLATTASKGSIEADASVINTIGGKAVKIETAGVYLKNTASLKLESKDILKENTKEVDDTKLATKGIAGEVNTTLTILDGSGKLSLTDAQFDALKKSVGDSFKGNYDVVVTGAIANAKDGMELSAVKDGLAADVYKGYTAKQDAATPVSGNKTIGNVEITGNGDALQLDGTNGASVTLYGKGDKLVYKTNPDKTTTAAGVSFTGANSALTLAGSGEIGAIKNTYTANAGNLTVGTSERNATVSVTGDIGESTANKALKNVTVNANSHINVNGGVYTENLDMRKGTSLNAKNGSGDVVVSGKASIMGDIDAASLSLSNTTATQHLIAGNADVDVTTLKLTAGNDLTIGQDEIKGKREGSSAAVFVDNLDLAAGSVIFIDPPYGHKATVLAAQNLADKSGVDTGVLSGDIFVGQNAAFGYGFDQVEFEGVMANYLDANSSFSDPKNGGLQNALVLGKPLSIKSGAGILVKHDLKDADIPAKKGQIANTLTLGAGSALILTKDAFGGKANDKTAITFGEGANDTYAAKVNADPKAKISLVGDFTLKSTDLKIFGLTTPGGTGIQTPTLTIDNDITVEAMGGLLSTKLAAGANGTLAKLEMSPDADKLAYAGVARSMGDFYLDLAKGNIEVNDKEVGYNFVVTTLATPGGFQAVDAAAHAATYAGAQQAAVAAVTTMAEAVGGRVGSMGVEAATISATGSQANGGVWLSPMYKSVDADGFNAEGASYGADVDLAGVAFGTDTVNGNMRFGAVFNIGSGDADGKGNGNGLKDEFDYYGFGIYSVMGFGNLALVGDASLNVISHDVEGLGLKGEADTTAVTMGITGQYTISNPMVDVTPHLGARFIRLDTDSYDLTNAKGTVATTDFEVQNVFSVPLGVTLSKAFEMGGWSLAPSADLSITFNTGDTEVDSTTRFTGINRNIGLNTEVLDEVTYGVAVGLGAQYGAFGTQIGINYTGSENTDAFGVNANARYMF